MRLPFPCSSKEADLSLCSAMLRSHPTPFPYPSILLPVTWYLWELRWPSMQTKLSKGVLKSKVPGDCTVKAGHSNLSNTSCFQNSWGKGHQDYFSVTQILLKQLLRVGVWFWGFLMLLCYPGAFCLPCAVVPHALFRLECSVKGCTSWLST